MRQEIRKKIVESNLNGIFELDKGKKSIYFTKNLLPGEQVYGEKLIRQGKDEFREFAPVNSKLAAAIRQGLKEFNLKENSIILYLGASTGTTVSHLSDVTKNGMIFAVESAPIVARDLVFLAEKRHNIAPILADANKPEEYKDNIVNVDFLYQDVAQKNQVQIFLKNLPFLKKGGLAFLAVKARSIDFAKKPEEVFQDVEKELKTHLTILQKIDISSFQKDHCVFVCKK
ncbi:fibrillarin-like rRNA/tRNA 2'-O-methyltransferase [Candidatus Woesearchaeota archaeon]|nr:fibrillarin-like rRNA/tRNA 2'-O-methyltransferase [Candidatus Woesearchaeota archaeon]